MTHKELVDAGAVWLTKQANSYYRCQYAVKEFRYAGCEEPDVFGIRSGGTVLIEVKVSRRDYLKDKQKPHRCNTNGLGNSKFYLCPQGLIKPEELAESWGLLYFHDGKITVIKQPVYQNAPNSRDEISLMYSILRRLTRPGILNKSFNPAN
jgi:hypothetical protein